MNTNFKDCRYKFYSCNLVDNLQICLVVFIFRRHSYCRYKAGPILFKSNVIEVKVRGLLVKKAACVT